MRRLFLTAAICLLCICAACGKQTEKEGNIQKEPTGTNAPLTATPSGTNAPLTATPSGTKDTVTVTPAGQKETITCFEDLSKEAVYLMELGDECANEGRNRQAVYFYSLAASHVCAVRYMVDYVLWLKGEGKTRDDVTQDRLADWATIGALNYSSCYADYCQYLLSKMQGKTEEATTFYNRAVLNPDCPPNDAFFEYKNKSVSELYEIKGKLASLEDQIFLCYKPYTDPLEKLCGYEYLPEYHVTLASFYLQLEDTESARRSLERAINTDPFNGSFYAMAALTAYVSGNMELMTAYLDEGMQNDPASASLHAMMAVVARAAKDTENEKFHLELANSAEKDAYAEQILAMLE